jgi:hypothetical protein
MSFVKMIKTYGSVGAVGVIPTFLNEKIKELATEGQIIDPLNPMDAEQAMVVNLIRGEYLGALMLSDANWNCVSLLRTDLQNQHGYGNDLYPKSVDQCLSVLNCWTVAPAQPWRDTAPPPTPAPLKQEDEALVFAQETTKGKALKFKDDGSFSKASSKTSSVSTASKCILAVRCKNCGRNGHASVVCPDLALPPAQIHAMNADNASQTIDASSVIILAQLLDQPIERNNQPINKDFVLVDSQSTVDLFSNPAHVTDICPTNKPIRVHCNKGTMLTTKQAKFGDIGVYFDSNSIANVLSLYRLTKKIPY